MDEHPAADDTEPPDDQSPDGAAAGDRSDGSDAVEFDGSAADVRAIRANGRRRVLVYHLLYAGGLGALVKLLFDAFGPAVTLAAVVLTGLALFAETVRVRETATMRTDAEPSEVRAAFATVDNPLTTLWLQDVQEIVAGDPAATHLTFTRRELFGIGTREFTIEVESHEAPLQLRLLREGQRRIDATVDFAERDGGTVVTVESVRPSATLFGTGMRLAAESAAVQLLEHHGYALVDSSIDVELRTPFGRRSEE